MKFELSRIPLVQDPVVRENLQQILDFFRVENHLFGFRHYELSFQTASTFQFMHRLGYLPKDAILTSQIGAGTVSFNYSSFTRESISITTTGPCVVRFFLGTYGG